MSAASSATSPPKEERVVTLARDSTTESPWVRRLLIGLAIVVMAGQIVLPLIVVFFEALREGWAAYRASVVHPETWQAIKLTLLTAAVAVPLNTLFGVAAAYCIAKFNFPGKSVLTTLIDLPFAVSPVVAGLCFVLLFGARGWFAHWLQYPNLTIAPPPWTGAASLETGWTLWQAREAIKVIFALPGIVLATVFITFPFVARELIPLMEAQGTDEESAARVLGAGGWQMFFRVTLPNIKWGLLYGLILCNARAMGEFGAVYVVSGNFSGQITLPLRVERAYYASIVSVVPAFAVASLLALLAVVTLLVKTLVEWKFHAELRAIEKRPEA